MKKLIALLLTAVMCLSLAACGGTTTDTQESSASAIIGTWESVSDPRVVINGESSVGTQVVINEDNTGIVQNAGNELEFTWVYDEATRTVIIYDVTDPTEVEAFTYLEVIDSLSNDWLGLFTKVEVE